MQGMLSQIRCFERELSNSFKKDNFIFLSAACHPYVTPMSLIYHSYVLVCHPFVTNIYSCIVRMALVCTCVSSVCHSYVLVCHPHITRLYSYAIRMSLVCTRMSFVCHSYVVLPWTSIKWTKASFLLLSLKLLQSVQ